MLFTSPVFVLFLLVVLVASRLPLRWGASKAFLLLASYFFYASWNPPFVLLLAGSTLVDFFAALRMHAARTPAGKRAWLIVSLVSNLGVLAGFKYATFAANTVVSLAGLTGFELAEPAFSIILPVGISFYTFQTLSYTIDVYRGRLVPTRNLVDFALFVSFFPQLVAGPIVRASTFLPQLEAPRRATSPMLAWGGLLFMVGLFKKAFLADVVFAPVTNHAFFHDMGTFMAWMGVWSFAGQIYCDFSGYTDMAIGCALMLGFHLPDNFRAPYGAVGFSDFWRRWHISLSTWLRDYLYVPLGGNRKGRVRTSINLMLVMLIGGLWHGASWMFVVWGGLHGLYLSAERVIRKLAGDFKPGALLKPLLAFVTFQLVCVAWLFFRAPDIGRAWTMLQAMVGINREHSAAFSRWDVTVAGLCLLGLLALHWRWRDLTLEDISRRVGWPVTAAVCGLMLFVVLTAKDVREQFIYFQF